MTALQRHFVQQEAERVEMGDNWQDTNLIFTTRTGKPVEPSGFNRLFNTVCKRAGIGHERVHNLRHTAGHLMRAMGGADLFDMQAVLGHSNIAVTAKYYGHEVPALQQDLAKRMSDLYGVVENPWLSMWLSPSPITPSSWPTLWTLIAVTSEDVQRARRDSNP